MKLVSWHIVLSFFWIVLFLCPVESVSLDDYRHQVACFQFDLYSDGRCEMTCMVRNSRNGRFKKMSYDEIHDDFTGFEIQPLIVDCIVRWPPGSEIVFEMTPDFVEDRHIYQEVIDKYFNANRGNKNVPRIRISDQVFEDLPDEIIDFCDDGHSTIIVTSDDRYVKNTNGRGLFSCDLETYEIYECDAYFRYKFFDPPYTKSSNPFIPQDHLDPRKLVVHEFGHCTGLLHCAWHREIMSCYFETEQAFEDENSFLWRQWRKRYNIHYDDWYSFVPRIGPPEKSVIDLTFATWPGNVSGDSRIGHTMVFITTNLKGVQGKPMKMEVYPGWLEPSLVFGSGGSPAVQQSSSVTKKKDRKWLKGQKPIVVISGDTIAAQWLDTLPTYHASHVRIGQKQYWETLMAELETNGKARNIRGVDYEKSLKVTVVITGFLDINSVEKSSVIRHLYLVASGIQ